jgi:lysophospholipase L1-like esterase
MVRAMKIVAFGDSLTVGETGFMISGSEEYPATYPKCLELLGQEYVRSAHAEVSLEVLNRGVNGDLTAGMLERFARDVVHEKPDYAIILGGTNDIGWGLDLATIIHNLTSMYDSALKNEISPLACSVPAILGFDELIPPRLDLNAKIRAESEKRNVDFIDLFKATADPRNNRLSEEYSADGLHLNSEGYRRLAECIFDGWLRAILNQELSAE